MKYILTLMLMTAQFSAAAALLTDQETRYSSTGYPYDLLIQRSDSIKIIYTENKENVACRITLENKNGTQTSLSVNTTKAKFEQAPLASCLARKTAKQWLADTF